MQKIIKTQTLEIYISYWKPFAVKWSPYKTWFYNSELHNILYVNIDTYHILIVK